MIKIKRLFTPILFMLSITTTNAAEYKKGFFIKGEVGKIFAQKFKETPGITPVYIGGSVSNYALYGVSVGYKFNSRLSTSLGLQFRRFEYNSTINTRSIHQKINNSFLMLSGHYNIPTSTPFTPYLSAGIGYTYNKPSNLRSKDPIELADADSSGHHTRAVAWNIGLGTKIKCSPSIDLDFAYRYMYLGKVRVRSTTDMLGEQLSSASQNLKGHQITLGVIFNI